MSSAILKTKLFIPPPLAGLVPRPRISAKIEAAVQAGSRFILVAAPAGFGKTTAVSSWIRDYERGAAWVSLDDNDNEPAIFWAYVTTALETTRPGMGTAMRAALAASSPPPIVSLLLELINELAGLEHPLSLILDDYHVIHNPAIHQSLAFLLNHQPPQLKLVIATRADPPLPLARWRAQRALTELRAEDLRFTRQEASILLNKILGLGLTDADISALEARTEGWGAGLQLAAQSMQGRSDAHEFVAAFSGSHHFILEYLIEEVLGRLPESRRDFLLQTSILERMNAGLCEAVTGCRDGQDRLIDLQRANLFVVPLDHEGRWYRYHHLFADLLQARLQQAAPAETIAGLHRRAADWFEEQGSIIEAIQHARAARDFDQVADLVKRAAPSLLSTGQVSNLKGWLKAIPEVYFQEHPELIFYLFWIDILQGKADLSKRAIQEKEALLKALPSTPENDRLRGELMAVVCRAVALSGRTSEGIRLAREALAYLPPDDPAPRARASSALATAYDLEGWKEEAGPAYRQAITQALAAGDYRLAAHTLMVKGLVQGHYGQLHEAARTFQEIIDLGDRAEIDPVVRASTPVAKKPSANQVFFPAGQGHIGLGSLHLERNDLETAENYLERGLELCRRGGLDGVFIGRMQKSRLCQAKGDLEGALNEIRLVEQASQRVDYFNLTARQIRIALARGDVAGAWRWAAPLADVLRNDSEARPPLLFLEIIEAVIARVYLAQGEIDEALQLLDKLQNTAKPGNRSARLLEAYLLKALAYQKENRGNLTSQTIESIEHALVLGEPEGYFLLFLEEGPALIPLLKAVIEQKAMPDRIKNYARKLLDAFGPTSEQEDNRQLAGLVEPLTPRETEVLELLAAGDSNQTIAEKLVITVRTVKKHTGNIYGKLNAESRTQAVARAHQLGLLSPD